MEYSQYYERNFTPFQIEYAFDLYVQWCKKNNIVPEVNSVSEINKNNIDHIMYHAEIEGFEIGLNETEFDIE